MKRTALFSGLAATVALSACAASPTLALPTGDASASTSASAGSTAAAPVAITDPTRPMFGGGIGSP
jgi:hypothetical protein